MAPGQRTFIIVPNPLGMQGLHQRPAGESVSTSHRPMTSKQAQKLHRQATKIPKMTRAEERAWEKKMQADIKEEKEKQRQSNKARMLREKKKEREQKIVEAKKRKGLPIVDVRPSQDLITRFVRGNGTAKKRDSSGTGLAMVREESPAVDSAAETGTDGETHAAEEDQVGDSDAESESPAELPQTRQSPAKRQRTESPEARHSTRSPIASHRRSPRASNTAITALRVLDHKSRESSMDVDDPAIEGMLTTQILEESISAANSSAIQQRSPVRSNGITLNQQVSQGKENIPPVFKATITSSECCVMKSPRRPAEAQPFPQRNSPRADSVTARKVPGSLSRASPVTAKSPTLSQYRISPKPRNAPNLGTQRPHQAAVSSVGEASKYDHLREVAKSPGPRTSPNGAFTGPVSRKIQQKETESLTARAPMVSSGPPAAAPAPNGRHQSSTTRKPLQETTINTAQPARAVSRPYSATRKSPPVGVAAPRPVSAVAKQSMPPPPQPTNRFKPPSHAAKRPKFLPKHLQTPQTRPPIGQTSHSPARDQRSIPAESAPPSSTQLFIHSFIDDIMPSPSQEARELQGIAPVPSAVSKPPLWKPPPRFAARDSQVVKQAMPPPPPPPPPKAPALSQTPTPRVSLPPLQLRQTIEPVLPFFSTQDFLLSSQDIRDLQDTTETPSKLPSKDTSRTTTTRANDNETPSKPQQPPSRPGKTTEQARMKVPIEQSTVTIIPVDRPQFPQPPRYVPRNSQPRTPVCTPGSSGNPCQLSQPQPRASCLNPVLSNPSLVHVAGPSQGSVRSSPLAQPQNVTAARPKLSTAENFLPTTGSPAPLQPSPEQLVPAAKQDTLPQLDPSPKPETPKASASPKKGRFFTASNEQVQLAMEKSLRTHKEEQRKREAEQRTWKLEEERQKREEERRQREEEDKRKREEAERRAREHPKPKAKKRVDPYEDYDSYDTNGGAFSDSEELDSEHEDMQRIAEADFHDDTRKSRAGMVAKSMRMCAMLDYNDECLPKEGYAKWKAKREAKKAEEGKERKALEEKDEEERQKKDDPYGLDDDFEDELLAADFDVADVQPQVQVPSGHGIEATKQEAKVFMASQETDYGDMDVTLEDLDDFL